ncbi:MAG: bifunctional UDP-N-acetylglucosamine diphosphorylase/glucosamine-1-phosphate N-acetyltransferase GlmU [Pseudomonadota bacterium]
MALSIIILAAGKGKRMKSKLPKTLHKIGGKPILEHVYNTAKKLSDKIFIVYGHGGDQVKEELEHLSATWVMQEQLLGTGHAVMKALPYIPDEDSVLVLVGDCPLISEETLHRLLKVAEMHDVSLVVADLLDPTGFGRILQDQTGRVIAIIEERDATTKQKQITTVNTGLITASAKNLKTWLPALKAENAQEEYYLTDIIALANADGLSVKAVRTEMADEILGVNDRIQLAKLERLYQLKIAEQLLMQGVTIMDPARFDCRGDISIEKDVTLDINTILEGEVKIGENSYIGANCYIKDAVIGKDVYIKPNTIIDSAVIDDHCRIGPFARIRPGTQLKSSVHIGNFVEIKKSSIDTDSKVNHLTYVGDTLIGKAVNVGAGTITCNYDGVNKHQTIIEDNVFIGSGVELVAPIKIEKDATIGAGSTITKKVPAGQLTLERSDQVNIPDWKRPKKKAKDIK